MSDPHSPRPHIPPAGTEYDPRMGMPHVIGGTEHDGHPGETCADALFVRAIRSAGTPPASHDDEPDFLDGARLEYRECREVRRLLGYLWTATGNNHLRPVHTLFDADDPIVADVERLAIMPDAETEPMSPELYPCWFCERPVDQDYLIAGYDTFDEARLACLDCDRTIHALRDKGWLRATPSEPVGGREALLAGELYDLLEGLRVWPDDPDETVPISQVQQAINEWSARRRLALQASPPTGVSDGVALDVARDELPRAEYARLLGVEDLARLFVSGWDHGYPLGDSTESEHELIDRLRTALAREQADSEPQP